MASIFTPWNCVRRLRPTTAAMGSVCPSTSWMARRPTGSTSRGRRISTSRAMNPRHSSHSSAVGTRSPPPAVLPGKQRTTAAGRDPDHIKIFIHGGPIVRGTDAQAERRAREIFDEDNDFDRSLALLGRSFGAHDFSQYDLDAPFPDLGAAGDRSFRTQAEKIKQLARDHNYTLRQVVQHSIDAQRSPFTGSANGIRSQVQGDKPIVPEIQRERQEAQHFGGND